MVHCWYDSVVTRSSFTYTFILTLPARLCVYVFIQRCAGDFVQTEIRSAPRAMVSTLPFLPYDVIIPF